MKRIKNFLCTADPLTMTGILILVLLFGGEAYLLGGWVFLLGMVLATIFGSLVVAIGWLLYKTIVFLQGLCK